MDFKEVQWPHAVLVAAYCGEKGSIINRKNWDAIINGSNPVPLECRNLNFITTGRVPEHAMWSVEFDDHWKISKISPLTFHES